MKKFIQIFTVLVLFGLMSCQNEEVIQKSDKENITLRQQGGTNVILDGGYYWIPSYVNKNEWPYNNMNSNDFKLYFENGFCDSAGDCVGIFEGSSPWEIVPRYYDINLIDGNFMEIIPKSDLGIVTNDEMSEPVIAAFDLINETLRNQVEYQGEFTLNEEATEAIMGSNENQITIMPGVYAVDYSEYEFGKFVVEVVIE